MIKNKLKGKFINVLLSTMMIGDILALLKWMKSLSAKDQKFHLYTVLIKWATHQILV